MAVRSREEIINTINTRLGADNSDDAIALIEDVTDTLADLEQKAKGDGKDWKAEAERIDKEWRKKYVERFSKGSSEEDDLDDPQFEERKDYSYDKLFK